MKVWTGSAWSEKPVKVWNGSAWVTKPLRYWDGTKWVPVTSAGGATAPMFRSVSSTTYTSRNVTTTVAKPTGVIDNDIMLAVWFTGFPDPMAASVVTAPAGWTNLFVDTPYYLWMYIGGFTGEFRLYWKRAASEPASYNFLHDGSRYTQIAIVSYSGCRTTGSPVNVLMPNWGYTQYPVGLSISPTVANTMLVYAGNNWSGTGYVPPEGMTERFDSILYVSDQTLSTAGATGDRVQGLDIPQPWTATMLALSP